MYDMCFPLRGCSEQNDQLFVFFSLIVALLLLFLPILHFSLHFPCFLFIPG